MPSSLPSMDVGLWVELQRYQQDELHHMELDCGTNLHDSRQDLKIFPINKRGGLSTCFRVIIRLCKALMGPSGTQGGRPPPPPVISHPRPLTERTPSICHLHLRFV